MIVVLWAMATLTAPVEAGAIAAPPPRLQDGVLTRASIARLGFLVGRWTGRAPDGTRFYEEYDFMPDGGFRSRRASDETFTAYTDGSTVEAEGGQVRSTWGPYSWRAVRLDEGVAEFEPIHAPGSFSWTRIDADHIAVSQRWTSEAGAPQGL